MGGIISLSTSNSSPSFVSLPNGSIEKVSSRGISQQSPSSITLPKNSLSDLIQKDTHVIRCKILNDIPLSFLHPTIILLYGPPLSYCDELGYFIASKCQMTLFNARDFVTFEEMYHELSRRIQKDDCQIGFILVNFPKSISEGEKFNNRTRRFKKVVLLLEQDFTVVFILFFSSFLSQRLLRAKCADWIHVPSGRRYHTTNNPPKSMKGTLDDVRNMYDDETAEPLQPV